MKMVYLAAGAALLVTACSPDTKTAAKAEKPKEVALGSKTFDLQCAGKRVISGKEDDHNITIHVDLKRLVYSAEDRPHLYPISEVTQHNLFLQNDPGEYLVINRGSGKLVARSQSENVRTESVCALKPYTDLGQVF